ncbi:MAG: PAS domain-containing protein, partial [Chitinophagaceae bacterium]
MDFLPEHIDADLATTTESVPRRVTFLINGRLTVLKADWQWDFTAAEVFCSNTFLHFSPSSPVLKSDTMNCLLHPDDLDFVTGRLARLEENVETLAFRIITTYGEVKHILASGTFSIEAGAVQNIETALEEEALQWKTQKEQFAQLEQAAVKHLEIEDAEKLLEFGTWHYNLDTAVMYFSNGVYRLFGLPPQSVNAHLHTFHRFIHKDDRDFAIEYFEKAFRMKLPLQIDFRIVWNSGEERYLSSSTIFRFSGSGALLLCGTLKDSTGKRQQEMKLAIAEA